MTIGIVMMAAAAANSAAMITTEASRGTSPVARGSTVVGSLLSRVVPTSASTERQVESG